MATAVEGTSEPLVLNEEFILSTLKNIFGDELQLSEKKLADLTKDFEKNYRTFFVSGVWPKLKSALARTEKARNIHDINEREKFVHDKVNEVMEALAA